LYSEGFHKLHSSPYITGQIKKDEMGREWGPNGNMSNAYVRQNTEGQRLI